MPDDDKREQSARERLIEWANSQHGWVRALAGAVLDTQQPPDEATLDSAYEAALSQYGLSDASRTDVPKLVAQDADGEETDKLILRALRDAKNVNRLAPEQQIAFNPRMTVLFGENGAGKSGYVRVLKRLAAVRSAEDILPNVHAPAPKEPPCALIDYSLGDIQDTEDWMGQSGVRPFTRMSVFDARAVTLHLEGDLTYVYTPRDLAFFKHTHEAIEGVRDRLQQACQATRPTGNPFLDRFDPEWTAYATIETLGPATDLPQLEALANVSKEEEETVEALRTTVEALRSDSIGTRVQVAQSDHALVTTLLDAAQTVANFDWDQYDLSVQALKAAEGRLTTATTAAFADQEIPGALTPSWESFIQAADTHWKDLGHADYHEDQDTCIYCRQSIGDTARDLLAKYHEFCNNTYREDRDNARAALVARANPIQQVDRAHLSASLEAKIAALEDPSSPPALFAKARELLSALEPVQERARNLQEAAAASLQALASETVELATPQLGELAELVATLRQQGEERETTLATEAAKLRELESRLVLKRLLPDITAHVTNAKWASQAETVLTSRIRPLLQSLTTASKAASEQLLNEGFSSRFESERQSLRAPKVNLAFPGRRGEAARRKTLPQDHRLSDILSEGEQKVIALADFLAEVSIRTTSAPLVFDDPVNSLDYRRLQYIVDRLFTLSKEHQVIVFTHNIWFAMALLAKFEKLKDEWAYYDVEVGDGEVPGIITGGQHPRYDTPSYLRARINELIQTAKTQSGEAQQALIEKGYSRLRAWCEVVVEQELFAGVTTRFEPNVRMTVLPQIKPDRLEAALATILPLFEKACRITDAHSQPLEVLSARPTIGDLEADWAAAQEALKAYKS